jgi:hypothetical protein
MVEWLLDLQLLVQSLPINTKVVSSNLVYGEVYSIKHYMIKLVSDLRQVVTPLSTIFELYRGDQFY